MIDIKTYSAPKGNGESNGGTSNTIIINNGDSYEFEPHYLWGQYFDDTEDIDGDLTSNGTIQGNNVVATTKVSGATVEGNIVNGATGNITTVNSDLINTKNINVTVQAIIKLLQSENITCDNLTVTKAAHFFQLIIDEIKATKGQIIVTSSNATIDLVESITNGYRCYFRASDADGKEIRNTFEANDQIICQTFNAASGTNYNTSNKFYWRLCSDVSSQVVNKTINGQNVPCWYIDLSDTDKDSNSNGVPEIGDEIVQLGNKTNTNRQAAIIISAYNNQFLDAAIVAPSIVQYSGINDYSLSSHRLNVLSNGLNSFKGNFTSTNGDDILTLIQQTNSAITTEVTNRINGDKKYFPIIKPFYDYEFKLITEYKDNPLRYYGDSDIYSTPTYVTVGTYKIRVFCTDTYLQDIIIASYGTNYPSHLGNYSGVSLSLSRTYNSNIKCKDNTTLYEFIGEVTISTAGYYGLNFWEDEYLYIPDMENEFETNYSRITQTANKISLSLYDALRRTGIDIENGTINLNADNTNVNGTLNVYEDNQGLQVWNHNKTQCAQISNLELGYLENYNPSAYSSYNFSKTQNISGTSYTFAFGYNSIGTAYPGVAMHINAYLNNAGMVGGDIYAFDGYGGNVSEMSYTVYLRNSGGTIRKSQSGNVVLPDPNARPGNFGVGLFSIDYTPSTSISSEILYIDLTLTINATSSHSGNAIAEVGVNFIQEISSTNKMAYDGIVLGTSNSNEYVWWGKKQIGDRTNYTDYAFMVRTRQNNFRVNDFGIWRTFYNQGYTSDNPGGTGNAAIGKYDDAYWGDISSTYPVYKTSSTSINFATENWSGILSIQRYGFIECTASGDATWTLPQPNICTGKYIIFKRRYAGHLYLTCTNKIIPRDNNVSAVMSTIDCEDDTVSIISDGEYWIVINKA